ncbi:SAM-dependent methyltransferase [Mycobacterium intermedium]|uniref:S-adenosyl-L-methionine-dependent methyltransferase n=1 Tax=Mycobacterium intermedium TaxID=28445 RepID=A0A1E3SKB6_MYCIE|nr:class I SAM-dependent methyltransferase [Mycobacterium intermedium]MCV6962862.1 class I SAM-dependent methyltransferase [Mycobacterium intermedium]ODR02586.1 SAM-dependent methyltransferase [Mycobacterium intermedium]OPE50378.1 SAM-dependent methyltransferase [Mycobacterium intermedium]ORB09953.1 SAM-dependent methyltransferase [Mycobacterium intermedium]
MTEFDQPISPPVSPEFSLRSDGDSWSITESVGATALTVAASRAVETSGPDPLIRDEFARILVSEAGPAWVRLADPSISWLDDDERAQRLHRAGCDYQAVRTHFFDEYFAAATTADIRQVVILASGLDTRAYRLNWPTGTVVYELDQPKVLEYKARVLESHGALPAAQRHAVAVDLRDDWPAALTQAGFDRDQPTAWLAEGLLGYLPSDAQDRLLEMCTLLSAPGSQLATEVFLMKLNGNKQRWNRMRRLGLDINIEALTYHEPDRTDPAQWLAEHGWQVSSVSNSDLMAELGRPIPEDLIEEAVTTTLVQAGLGGSNFSFGSDI